MFNIFKKNKTKNEEDEEEPVEKEFKLHLTRSTSLNRRRLKMYLRKIKNE